MKKKHTHTGCPGGSESKESACKAGDPESVLGSEGSPGEGNGYPLQYSCLENSIHRSLAGYSPWGHEELDTTEGLTRAHTQTSGVGTEEKVGCLCDGFGKTEVSLMRQGAKVEAKVRFKEQKK